MNQKFDIAHLPIGTLFYPWLSSNRTVYEVFGYKEEFARKPCVFAVPHLTKHIFSSTDISQIAVEEIGVIHQRGDGQTYEDWKKQRALLIPEEVAFNNFYSDIQRYMAWVIVKQNFPNVSGLNYSELQKEFHKQYPSIKKEIRATRFLPVNTKRCIREFVKKTNLFKFVINKKKHLSEMEEAKAYKWIPTRDRPDGNGPTTSVIVFYTPSEEIEAKNTVKVNWDIDQESFLQFLPEHINAEVIRSGNAVIRIADLAVNSPDGFDTDFQFVLYLQYGKNLEQMLLLGWATETLSFIGNEISKRFYGYLYPNIETEKGKGGYAESMRRKRFMMLSTDAVRQQLELQLKLDTGKISFSQVIGTPENKQFQQRYAIQNEKGDVVGYSSTKLLPTLDRSNLVTEKAQAYFDSVIATLLPEQE